jgi:nitrite reductase (NADH) large subunit
MGVYKRLVIERDRIRGAVLYGDVRDGNWYLDLINEGRDIRGMRDRLLFGAPSETATCRDHPKRVAGAAP